MTTRRIEIKQYKTGKEVSFPIAQQLYDCLLVARKWMTDEYGYICPKVAERYNKVDKNGKNVGNNLVDIDVLRVVRWIGLEPSVNVPGRKKAVTVYGFHSLRHSFASHAAELGVPRSVIESILGDDSKIVAKYYTHVGHEAQKQAIDAVAGTVGVLSAQERIDKALEVIDSGGDSQEILDIIVKVLRDGKVITKDDESTGDSDKDSASE
jgi:integrase